MNWPVEIWVALRYLRPRRSFVSAIALLSVLGVTLGVAVLIVVLSVMAGFERDLRDKIIGFNAHVVVDNGSVMEGFPEVQARIAREPGVLGAAPFVTGPVFADCDGRESVPFIRGIDPEAEEGVIPIKKCLVAGEYELRGDSVIVGREWARRYGAVVGDKVTVYGPRQLQSLRSARNGRREIVLPVELLITGVFETGLYSYDSEFFISSLETAQNLYGIPGAVHGIAIRAADPLRLDDLKRRLDRDLGPGFRARTWMDQNRSLFSAIETERVTMAFIVFFVMIVAAFGLCSTLITITVQKTREIGVLKAIGAGEGQVLRIFVTHGLVVGAIGAGVGTALGWAIVAYINPLRDFLNHRFGLNLFPADVYNFARIPVEISAPQVGAIALSAVVVCSLAALIPARIASRLDPAEALRHE